MIRAGGFGRILAMALALGAASIAHAGDGEAWSVSKSSGEVWMTTTGAQTVSLSQQDILKPGDTIRTGRNGRALPIGLPIESKDGLSTTIVQQAGSILLEVEKRNVKHFEVETPYLAAVVKGTQFRVSVNAGSTSIEVIRGQVEVADFRSGQVAQVMPGQLATASAHGKAGLHWADRARSLRSNRAGHAHPRSNSSWFRNPDFPRRATRPTGRSTARLGTAITSQAPGIVRHGYPSRWVKSG
jgi:hypothetical protein